MAVKKLGGKLVLITGAACGIGRATALEFAERGARVIATDLQPAPLEALRFEIEARGTTCATYADDVHAAHGPLDVLVNNAGIGYLGPFLEERLAHWPRVLNVNVMGVVHGCYFFIPRMIAAGGARQVVIARVGSRELSAAVRSGVRDFEIRPLRLRRSIKDGTRRDCRARDDRVPGHQYRNRAPLAEQRLAGRRSRSTGAPADVLSKAWRSARRRRESYRESGPPRRGRPDDGAGRPAVLRPARDIAGWLASSPT